MVRTSLLVLVLLATACLGRVCHGEGPIRRLWQGVERSLPKQTLGGRFLWSDVHHEHGWRIQRHVMTDHHRLLDGRNRRHESGTLDECLATFASIVDDEQRRRPVERIAVLVHGLGNWSGCLRSHASRLRKEGYCVVPFDYASSFVAIDEAAADLEKVIRSLPPTNRIDFVGHSMGGLVVRSLFSRVDDERFGRVVLLGTPNHGAQIAEQFRDFVTFRLTTGPAGRQLGDPEFIESLPVPSCEFACIAGGRRRLGYNPFLKGNDDGLVRVESVRLDGASDFEVMPLDHHALLYSGPVVEMTCRFLQSGRFRDAP